MLTLEQSQPPARALSQPFFLGMSLLLAAIVIYGFSHTVPHDLQPPGLPLLLKCHAAIFITWVALFIAQPAFIRAGAVRLHRRLGLFGVALAIAMVTLGTAAILFALHAHTLPPFYPPGLFLARGLISLAVFIALLTAAILARRHRDWHKRLMLCAAIVVIVPGLERSLPVFLYGPHWYVVIDALVILVALLGPAADLIERRRIHPAYLYGIAAILCGQGITDLLAPSPLLTPLLNLITS